MSDRRQERGHREVLSGTFRFAEAEALRGLCFSGHEVSKTAQAWRKGATQQRKDGRDGNGRNDVRGCLVKAKRCIGRAVGLSCQGKNGF